MLRAINTINSIDDIRELRNFINNPAGYGDIYRQGNRKLGATLVRSLESETKSEAWNSKIEMLSRMVFATNDPGEKRILEKELREVQTEQAKHFMVEFRHLKDRIDNLK